MNSDPCTPILDGKPLLEKTLSGDKYHIGLGIALSSDEERMAYPLTIPSSLLDTPSQA